METKLNQNVLDFLAEKKLNYTVAKEQAVRVNSEGEIVKIPGQFHLIRSTDGEVVSPKTVSKGYVETWPSRVIEPVAPLVAEGWIKPDQGFLFKGGSYEVMSFEMSTQELENEGKIAGESWKLFMSLHNHQGGGGGLKGSITAYRLICSNTVAAAAREACFSIPHRGNLDANYKWAIDQWQKLKDAVRKLSERMTIFGELELSPEQALAALETLYGVEAGEEPSTRTANELAFAMTEFANPRRGTYGRTGADLFNAVTATNSHYAPKNSKEDATKRLSSLYDMNGSRFKLENDAVTLLEEMAGV